MQILLAKILLNRLTWYSASTGLACWLVFAPVLGQWGNRLTAWAFGASAPAIAASVWLGQGLDRKGTLMQVNNHLGTQWQIDRLVDDINLGRAQFQATTDQLLGNNQSLPGLIQNLSIEGGLPQLPAGHLPTEDICQTIAHGDSSHMNVAIAGETGAGKTSVTINALKAKHDAERGNIDIRIFNGKPEKDNDWGGLINSPEDYMAVNRPQRSIDMKDRFKACQQTIQDWQDGDDPDHAPMLLLFDEVNNQRLLLDKNSRIAFDETMKVYITQCRSENSGCWVMTHSYLVDDLGLNKSLQRSFNWIILGRASYDLISSAINDHRLISSKELRQQLRQQFDAFAIGANQQAIALTNVGGKGWRLVQLPHYSKSVQIERGVLNQSVGEIIDAIPAENHTTAEHLNDALEASLIDQLPDALKTILKGADEAGGSISARDANRLPGIKNKSSADEVKGMFQQLTDMGWGVVQVDPSDSRRLVFWLFEARRAEL